VNPHPLAPSPTRTHTRPGEGEPCARSLGVLSVPYVLWVLYVLFVLFFPHPAQAAPPRRVISLAPSLTEMAFALGAGNQLVGVTSYCNYPPAADKLPEVGALADGSFDFERIVSFKPDLVLALDEGQTQTIATLRRLGLRVEVIPAQTVDDIFTGLTRLGRLLGRETAAKRLHADLKRRIDRIRKATAAIPKERRPRVFFEVWDEPLMAGTRRSLAGQLIELAGGVNIFGDLPGRYVQVSPEAVLERNPQVLVAPDTHTTTVDRRSLINRPGLSGIDAARNGRILILDGDLISRAGPRIAEALEMLVEAIHPGLLAKKKALTP
jgi:iron complex transport system substrate-binding protein